MTSLYDVFDKFCDASADTIRWKDGRQARTRFALEFFKHYATSMQWDGPYQEYMSIDAIWRDSYSGYIVFALEHENKGDVESFVKGEISHLADLKSLNKVAVTYPHAGEETRILEAVKTVIGQRVNVSSNTFGEDYLIIFGFPTWQSKHRAIRWNGYFLNNEGKLLDSREKVVSQSGKP